MKKLEKIPRTPLKDRPFPDYSRREELFNSVSHACGVVVALVLMWIAVRAAMQCGKPYALVSSVVYVSSLLVMFLVSSVYHGLPKGMPKQVMRVVDHCNIFVTIAGTYTPIMMLGVLPINPAMAWSILAVEWGVAVIGVVLNAIDLKKYQILDGVLSRHGMVRCHQFEGHGCRHDVAGLLLHPRRRCGLYHRGGAVSHRETETLPALCLPPVRVARGGHPVCRHLEIFVVRIKGPGRSRCRPTDCRRARV